MSGEVRAALSALGLTDYEIRTYVSLLEQGPLTALNISSESGIPYSRVYDVLKTLEKKQFVTAGKGRPTIYVAKSPDEATRALILKQSKQLEGNRQKIVDELQTIFEQGGSAAEHHDLHVLHGEPAILAKLESMLNRVEQSVLILTPLITALHMHLLSPLLKRLVENNKQIRFLISSKTGPDELSELRQAGEVRWREGIYGGAVIVDEREIILMLPSVTPDLEQLIGMIGIWSDHFGLAQLGATYFEFLWRESGEKQDTKELHTK
jgi:sugar-specific transcriptional regulator TrmB